MKKNSFTMAEILISLTIIGVIAAITLPALRANINEKTWATQKKALFSRMSQAVALLDSTNSYTNAQAFITEGLNDVLKINNICDGSNLHDCGIYTTAYINMSGVNNPFPKGWGDLGITGISALGSTDANTSATNVTAMVGAFETQNGESIALFYNPDCVPDNEDIPAEGSVNFDQFQYVCANMIYDLNQDKGPNTVGKDIGFMTVFYASDPVVVSPIPAAKDAVCSDKERIPTLNEAVSLQLNNKLLGSLASSIITSAKAMNGSTPYNFTTSAISSGKTINAFATTSTLTSSANNTRCVKR